MRRNARCPGSGHTPAGVEGPPRRPLGFSSLRLETPRAVEHGGHRGLRADGARASPPATSSEDKEGGPEAGPG